MSQGRTAPLVSLLIVAALAMLSLAGEATAADLKLRLSNDLVPLNPRPDDLYTSDISLELTFDRFRIVAGERMFTDRERDLRFDEAHLAAAFDLSPIAGWESEGSVGVLRIGQGLLGEDTQNRVHRLINRPEVELMYVNDNHHYATAGLKLRRTLYNWGDTHMKGDIDLSASPGFRSWSRANATVERVVMGRGLVQLGTGIRLDLVDNKSLFGDRIEGASATAHASVSYRGLEVRWAWNDYGTRTPHITLGFRTAFSR